MNSFKNIRNLSKTFSFTKVLFFIIFFQLIAVKVQSSTSDTDNEKYQIKIYIPDNGCPTCKTTKVENLFQNLEGKYGKIANVSYEISGYPEKFRKRFENFYKTTKLSFDLNKTKQDFFNSLEPALLIEDFEGNVIYWNNSALDLNLKNETSFENALLPRIKTINDSLFNLLDISEVHVKDSIVYIVDRTHNSLSLLDLSTNLVVKEFTDFKDFFYKIESNKKYGNPDEFPPTSIKTIIDSNNHKKLLFYVPKIITDTVLKNDTTHFYHHVFFNSLIFNLNDTLEYYCNLTEICNIYGNHFIYINDYLLERKRNLGSTIKNIETEIDSNMFYYELITINDTNKYNLLPVNEISFGFRDTYLNNSYGIIMKYDRNIIHIDLANNNFFSFKFDTLNKTAYDFKNIKPQGILKAIFKSTRNFKGEMSQLEDYNHNYKGMQLSENNIYILFSDFEGDYKKINKIYLQTYGFDGKFKSEYQFNLSNIISDDDFLRNVNILTIDKEQNIINLIVQDNNFNWSILEYKLDIL